jgi:hypothetical protein
VASEVDAVSNVFVGMGKRKWARRLQAAFAKKAEFGTSPSYPGAPGAVDR